MSKHYRQSCYDEPMDWMVVGKETCNGCGKEFPADRDNQFMYANGAVVFYCDRCMRLGMHELQREYEPYER